ncbi:MAG: hypothetical protein HXX19_17865, partial [Rhodoferax sp.]|nr:hypothetical protein [Rhodoferax sp.]
MPSNTSPSFANQAPPSHLWRWLGVLATVLALGAAAFILGPRNDSGPFMPSPRPLPPADIHALTDWLQTSEAAFSDIRPGNAKGIVWAGAAGERTR